MINKENLDQYIHYFVLYFGRTPEYYTERLNWYFSGKKGSFNIYAFFLGLYWLLFRKMYKPFFLIMLFVFIFGIIGETLLLTGVVDQITYSYFDIILLFILSSCIGCFSNKWYIKKSIKTVENVINNSNDPNEVEMILKKKGGTTMLGPIILIVFAIISALIGSSN